MGVRGVLFDLDDTLLVDDAHVEACFLRVTANVDGAAGVAPGTVARSVRIRARELWRSSPYHALVMALGFSSWEGLAADFSGGHPSLHPLRQWVPTYRVESWTAGLEEFGATQHALDLATRYRSERRESYRLVADALDVVDAFRRAGWAVGIVTNGPPDLQREKLTATGLLSRVDAVAISGELGCGKPDAGIFESTLRRLEVEPSDALMVGDSVHRDMEGAASLSIPAVWCRNGRTDVRWPDSINSLTELLTRLELTSV
jgi:putative hydrolase of the HAD superfamily